MPTPSVSYRVGCPALFALLALAGGRAWAADLSWAKPVDGDWFDSGSWNGGSRPRVFDDVELGLFAPYVVRIETPANANSLVVSNPQAELAIRDGAYLTIRTNVQNDGVISIDPGDGAEVTQLRLASESTLSGEGRVRLGGPMARLVAVDGARLTNQAPHVIEGVGGLEGDLHNQSLIEAKGDGGLAIFYNSEITQSKDGLVRASGPGSRFELNATTIQGGRVETNEGGAFAFTGSGSLRDVLVTGDFVIDSAGAGVFYDSRLVDARLTITGSSPSLSLGTSNQLIGEGWIMLDSDQAQATLDFGNDALLPVGYTVRGRGRLDMRGVNRSQIWADNPLGGLSIVGGYTNEGLMGARDGGTMNLNASVINTEDGGLISQGKGSRLVLNASITGGAITSTEGGVVEIEGSAFLTDAMLLAPVTCGAMAELSLTGMIYSDREILVSDTAEIGMRDQTQLYGPGRLVLLGAEAGLGGGRGAEYGIGEDYAIEGAGWIGNAGSSAFVNAGLVSANREGETLRLIGLIENQGRLEAINGALLHAGSGVDQGEQGVIVSDGHESFVLLKTVLGGELRSTNGGRFGVEPNATLRGVRINCDLESEGIAYLRVGRECELNGLLEIAPGALILDDDTVLGGSGVIRLISDSVNALLRGEDLGSPIELGPDLRLEGNGRVLAAARFNGVVAPGREAGERADTLTLLYATEFTDSSVLEIELGAESEDYLDSQSTLSVGGTLRVSFLSGFEPQESWSRVIARATDIESGMLSLEMPQPSSGMYNRYYNSGTELLVGQADIADMTLDGAVNFFDVSVFLGYVNEQNPLADLNADGSINFFDVSLFLQAFR